MPYTSSSILSRQPVKALFTLYFVTTTLIRFPFLILYFSFPSNRPHPSWSFKATIFSYVTKILFEFQAKVETKTPWSLDPGKEKDDFEVFQPAKTELLQGPLSIGTDIYPVKAGGLWIPHRYETPAPLTTSSSTASLPRFLLHFHGGAFVVLSPRVSFAQFGPKIFCNELPAVAAFSVQYRLASNPNGAFPAPLQDAVAAYAFLLNEKKIAPEQIVLSGDSAGANLVLGLLRYIEEHPGLLPLPQAALLSSPWLDLTKEGNTVDPGRRENANSDYFTTRFLSWGAESFVPEGVEASNAYISPLYHPFATRVPIWVQAGTAEFLFEDIKSWVERMKAVPGNVLDLYEQQDAMHSIFSIAENVDMVDRVLEGARSAKRFLENNARHANYSDESLP